MLILFAEFRHIVIHLFSLGIDIDIIISFSHFSPALLKRKRMQVNKGNHFFSCLVNIPPPVILFCGYQSIIKIRRKRLVNPKWNDQLPGTVDNSIGFFLRVRNQGQSIIKTIHKPVSSRYHQLVFPVDGPGLPAYFNRFRPSAVVTMIDIFIHDRNHHLPVYIDQPLLFILCHNSQPLIVTAYIIILKRYNHLTFAIDHPVFTISIPYGGWLLTQSKQITKAG